MRPHVKAAFTTSARYGKHVRHALIGFTSSVVADTLCNPIRVLKVNRQASLTRVGYLEAARGIISAEGFVGLWSRGLKTRILANGALAREMP